MISVVLQVVSYALILAVEYHSFVVFGLPLDINDMIFVVLLYASPLVLKLLIRVWE